MEQRCVAAVKTQRPPIPDHPPYAEMVGAALRALAEPGGSSEGAISDYIVSSFSGLPSNHDNFLPFYLRKLVSSSYLRVPSPGRYLLSAEPKPKILQHHPRRRPAGSTQKKSSASVVLDERLPSSARRPRGRPRKHPLPSPSPSPSPSRDKVVQKRRLIVRLRTKPPDGSYAPVDVDRKVSASNEKEESWRPRSEDAASCLFNWISLPLLSINYEADEEPILVDPLEELVWGLPMQQEPEAVLWLPSQPAMDVLREPTVERCDPKAEEMLSPAPEQEDPKPKEKTKAEVIPHQELGQETEGHVHQVSAVTMRSTVEDELHSSAPVTTAEVMLHQELGQEAEGQVQESAIIWSTLEEPLPSSFPVRSSKQDSKVKLQNKEFSLHGEQHSETKRDGKLKPDECQETQQHESNVDAKQLQPLYDELYFLRQLHHQTEGELLLVDHRWNASHLVL